VATLSVRNRVSRDDAVELIEELFGARISSGTIDAILTRTAAALAEPHDDLLGRLRGAQALNMDETGLRTAGQRRALWACSIDTMLTSTKHAAPKGSALSVDRLSPPGQARGRRPWSVRAPSAEHRANMPT
jgi:hypothetical protein